STHVARTRRPTLPGALPISGAAATGPACPRLDSVFHHVRPCHQLLLVVPPVRRLIVNTRPAKTRVTTAIATPTALAYPNWFWLNASRNRYCGITRVELSGPPELFSTCMYTNASSAAIPR